MEFCSSTSRNAVADPSRHREKKAKAKLLRNQKKKQHRYATGRALKEAGVEPGLDMTCEAAVCKLAFLLGRVDDGQFLFVCFSFCFL